PAHQDRLLQDRDRRRRAPARNPRPEPRARAVGHLRGPSMPRTRVLVATFALGILLPTLSFSQANRPERIAAPKFDAVAETQLLMEGMVNPNFRGAEKTLRGKPDGDAWTFMRGQALLIAEAGNLLLMRPPRNQGRDAWMNRAADLR